MGSTEPLVLPYGAPPTMASFLCRHALEAKGDCRDQAPTAPLVGRGPEISQLREA